MNRLIIFAASLTDPLPKPTGAADSSVVQTILNIVFGITAAIALLMIVIAGFRYIVASGNPTATAQARKTIIYAAVGLIVTTAAYTIVTFIVRQLIS